MFFLCGDLSYHNESGWRSECEVMENGGRMRLDQAHAVQLTNLPASDQDKGRKEGKHGKGKGKKAIHCTCIQLRSEIWSGHLFVKFAPGG